MGFQKLLITGVWRPGVFFSLMLLVSGAFGGTSPVAGRAGFSVKLDGREVPVFEHWAGGRLNCAYAHFTVTKAVPVEVVVDSEVREWSLSPARHELVVVATTNSLRFKLPTPLYLVLTVNNVRMLLLADPPEPPLPAATILDVTSAPFSADATGTKDATASLQRALDKAGELGNGAIVHFPPGRYTTTGLRVKSRTEVHLASGALLQGSTRVEDYPEYQRAPDLPRVGCLLRVMDAEGVHIFGHGTLDAKGLAFVGDATDIRNVKFKTRCLTISNSSRVVVEGLICRESTSWSVPFYNSTDVTARRLKVINDLGPLKHSDGINLCAVRNGTVEDCFVHTTDDAYCAKGHEGGPSENLVFRRLIALSATRGLKCGMQAYEPMRKVLFEQVDVVQTRDGMDLMHQDGFGEWSDIIFRDVRVEKCGRNGIMGSIRDGGNIRNVRFEDVIFQEARPGFLLGKNATNRIEGVIFSNLVMGGKLVTNLDQSGIEINGSAGKIRFTK